MRKYLNRISAACGIPDASEACRTILKIVKEAEEKEDLDHIRVRVSGSEIYKAVSNYLHHSEDIQHKIKELIKEILTKELMEKSIQKVAYDHLFCSYGKKEAFEEEIKSLVKKETRKAIPEEIQKYISVDMIKSTVGSALKKFIGD